MKKLIETYCVKQSVVPAAIQLIFKGNPVHESDTPEHLNLCSDDVLEVCRVPGIPLKDHTNERKNEPGRLKSDYSDIFEIGFQMQGSHCWY